MGRQSVEPDRALGRPRPGNVETAQGAIDATQVEINEVDAELERVATGVPYTVLSAAVVRSEAAIASAKIGALPAGQEILVLEKKRLQDGTDRLRFSGGWISERPKKNRKQGGKVLATPKDPDTSQEKLLDLGFTAQENADDSAERAAITLENAKMRQELAQIEAEIAHTDIMIEKATDAKKDHLSLLRLDQMKDSGRARPTTASTVETRGPGAKQHTSRPRSAPTPSAARQAYTALGLGVIRRGPELSSAKAGTKLVPGQQIEALEKRTLKDGTIRLRVRQGWVTEVAKSGKRLLAHCSEKIDGDFSNEDIPVVADKQALACAKTATTMHPPPKVLAPATVESLAMRLQSMAAQLDAISHTVVHMEARITKLERTQEEMLRG